jgi:hypothetical protein
MMRGTGEIMRGTGEMMRGIGEMIHDTGEMMRGTGENDLSLYLSRHVLNVCTRFDGMKMNRKSYCEFSLLFLTIKINFQFNFD